MGYNTQTNTYDTFSDLRLAIGQSSASVHVVGKTSIGDQGGGSFYWDDSSTETDDNTNIIKPTVNGSNPGRWKRFNREDLQSVTNSGSVTTNGITVSSLISNGNITPGLTTLPTGTNIGNNIIAAGGTGNQNLNFGTRDDGRFIFQSYGTSFGNPIAEFNGGPVIGQPAQASNQFATLSQVQTFGLLFENYPQYTSISATGPDAVIFVDQDNSPSGDNTESQFFRHNNKLFYIPTIEQ